MFHDNTPGQLKRADRADDQLPLISRVGRGLQGRWARVGIDDPDTTDETHLYGESYDPSTSIWTTEWTSENINGGELRYQYNLNPHTIPRTFTITFKYSRPGRPEWSWVTPAIPYIWGADDNGTVDKPDHIVGSGVATLFVRTAHTNWNERLKYPDGFTRDDFNAPLPDEAWAATITFGHGGDIDVPDFDDIAKIIGITKQDIYNILEDKSVTINGVPAKNLIEYIDAQDENILKHVHLDMGFGDGNLKADGGNLDIKSYIDKMVDNVQVVSANTNLLKVNTNKFSHEIANGSVSYGIKHTLVPASIIGGPGISVSKDNHDNIVITNTQVGGTWQKLSPGTDFDCKWHNGWYSGRAQTKDVIGSNAHDNIPEDRGYPIIYVIPSYDTDGNLIGAEVNVKFSEGDYLNGGKALQNGYDLLSTDSDGDLNRFAFRHASSIEDRPLSAIVSFTFKGDWAPLNNMKIVKNQRDSVGIWDIKGTNDNIRSADADWDNPGASWGVVCNFYKDAGSSYKKFTISAVQIPDGYNGQYTTPKYGYSHLCIRPWAGCSMYMTLG